MILSFNQILKFAALLLIGAAACLSQTPTPSPQLTPTAPPGPYTAPVTPRPLPAFYRNLVILDPAHGGPDSGAHLPDNALEKDVTLTFAQRLRPALTAQGFTVASTRDSDPAAPGLTTDQRAGIANHIRPLACILIHATATGSGVHIASSSLTPPDDTPVTRTLPWETAQASAVIMSLRLANEIGISLIASKMPVTLLRASVPPIDNLICPAVVIELAPLTSAAVTDAGYQQQIAGAIATALSSFRAHNAPPPSVAPSPAPAAKPAPNPSATTPSATPAPKPGVPQ